MTELTHEELTRILDYDHETGVFRWKVGGPGRKIGGIVGTKNTKSNSLRINRKLYSGRKLAWFYMHKKWPERDLFVKELGPFNDSIKNIGMTPEKPEELTQEYLKECIDYNPETGSFKWKIGMRGTLYGDKAYSVSQSYPVTGILGKIYRTKHLIWLYMTGEFPSKEVLVKTKNNIMTDLRWDNLVTGSPSEAQQKKKVASKTGFKGVCFNKKNKKYQAYIKRSGKQIHLGMFPTPEEAHEAYMKAAYEHFGELHNDGYQHVSFED